MEKEDKIMEKEYKIVDEFESPNPKFKGKVLVLDKKREWFPHISYKFNIGEKVYPYKLTHIEEWIIVESDDKFLGKTIVIKCE